jgi:hypothetical protein
MTDAPAGTWVAYQLRGHTVQATPVPSPTLLQPMAEETPYGHSLPPPRPAPARVSSGPISCATWHTGDHRAGMAG